MQQEMKDAPTENDIARDRLLSATVIGRSKRIDRIAKWVITGGGVITILTVCAVLFLIVAVALPLFVPPKHMLLASFSLPPIPGNAQIVGAGMDEYQENGFVIDATGTVHFIDLRNALLTTSVSAAGEATESSVVSVERVSAGNFSLTWADGSASLIEVEFATAYGADGQSAEPSVTEQSRSNPPADKTPLRSFLRVPEEGKVVRVDPFPDRAIRVSSESSTENLLGEVTQESVISDLTIPDVGEITALCLSKDGTILHAGSSSGHLLRWNLADPAAPVLEDNILATPDGVAVTALGFVFGDISIAVGDASGRLSTWFQVPGENDPNVKKLRQIHTLESHPSAVISIEGSERNKSIASLGVKGSVHVDHMTSERNLFALSIDKATLAYAFSARANGVLAIGADRTLTAWSLDAAHPEISFSTLFGRVWYENYPEPDYVWQSSAANDDNEPKMSLIPLIFGSLKGTFYAMILAVPMALFGAIYMSQFASPQFRGFVKPAIEIMAAIPSVVVGFLAALWLAPIVEEHIIAFFLFLVTFPLAFLAFIAFRQLTARTAIMKILEKGYEFIAIVPVIMIATWAAYALAPPIEGSLFGGDFKAWFFSTLGGRYDQRNCIIISFALGFCVIPLIFTLAEDALSNVPHSLKAASLALGASRWQTVWRVVLPSASPGIFAAMIIGLGRAVGETMIVLMATGNTPILDPSVFNGMRTLSANIAVEIPEAPLNGTLYRILFLSAVLLFLLTSVLNTTAELVRHRLRKKYGQFQ